MVKRVNTAKASGPDKLSGKLVKLCAEQLSSIFCVIFNMSWETHKIPLIWKTSEIIPVPKKKKITCNNDLRPVALTSILKHLLSKVHKSLDPHQFAYKPSRGTEDAILLMLERLYHHLDTPKHYARVLFIDFSSAFNTIQPHLMIQKLSDLNVGKHFQAWILNFLINRPQYVKANGHISQTREISTGAPQGCVLSPVLYTIYTNDIRSPADDTVPIIKFADDTAIVGLVCNDESHYYKTIENFYKWCENNYLILNVQKTKEMIVDFRKGKHQLADLQINNQKIDQVEQYKYLGVTLNNKLSWSDQNQSLYTKIHQRLFYLRKLQKFNIDKTIIKLFYTATVGSLITFAITCWYGNTSTSHKHRLNRLINKASRTTKTQLPSLEELFHGRCLTTIAKILQDNSHPLHNSYAISRRSGRLISVKTRTERYKNSFVPLSVRIFQRNSSSARGT